MRFIFSTCKQHSVFKLQIYRVLWQRNAISEKPFEEKSSWRFDCHLRLMGIRLHQFRVVNTDLHGLKVVILRQRIRNAKVDQKRLKMQNWGIIERRLLSIVGNVSTNNFIASQSYGNCPKTRKLSAIRIKAKRRGKIFHLQIATPKAKTERLFAWNCNWWWKINSLRQSKA